MLRNELTLAIGCVVIEEKVLWEVCPLSVYRSSRSTKEGHRTSAPDVHGHQMRSEMESRSKQPSSFDVSHSTDTGQQPCSTLPTEHKHKQIDRGHVAPPANQAQFYSMDDAASDHEDAAQRTEKARMTTATAILDPLPPDLGNRQFLKNHLASP